MAENINISFAPNKNADEAQRIADIENYLQTLTERTKFALSTIIENYNETDDNKTSQLKQNIALQSVSDSVRVSDSVGKFTDADKTSEIFNDYSGNTAHGRYSHVEGYKNRMDSEGAILSWATHIEGYENTEASQTSCPSDKKASNNHIEGRMNTCYGRLNHIEGGSCFADYDTQMCHLEGNNSHVSEGARVAHVEGKDCVAGNECTHAEGKSTQATGYASHAEGESCIASGNYSHAGGLSSEASGKCSYTGGELGTASGDYSHTEGLSNTASGAYSYALGKNNTAIGEYSVASGVESKAKGGYDIAHGYKCIANENSVAIGVQNEAISHSYAFGYGLKAYLHTVAFGMYNKDAYARFVIGGGTAKEPFDVLRVDSECNLHVAGKVIANGGIDIPIATAKSVGGVKIGDNIAVAADGTISVDLSGYLKSADISDWAKQPEKPVYTADEVGAAAEQHTHSTADITDFPAVPTKVSELQNDSGYLSTETDPTVPAWAKADTKPTYTASEVGAAESVHTHEQSDITGLASALASKANTSHTHTKSQITDFPTSLKNPNALTVQFNGATNQTYDGSVAKTVNITPAGIGAATAEDITTAIDAVNIGVRNIATGTASMTVGAINTATWSNGQWRYSGTGSIESIDITDSPIPSISKGIRVTSSASNKQIGIVQDKIPLNSDNIYTLSCWVRGSAASGLKCKLQPFYASSTDNGGASEINITDQWQYVSFTTVRSPQNTAEYSAAYVYLISSAIGDTMDICGVKLERGNKATDWCPAPEDLAIVGITAENPSEGILTYIPFCKGVSNGTNLLINNGVRYNTKEGTTTSDGYAEFILGNNIPTGTVGNKFSALRMYGHNDKYESFRPYERTGNATKYLVGASSSTSVGDTDTPVYINSDGVVTPTGYKFSDFMLASGKGAISEEHSFWSGTSSHTFNYVTGRNRAFIVAWMDDAKSTYMGFNLIYAATTVNTTSAVRLAYNGTVSMSYNISNGNITIGGGAGGYVCRCAVIWFTV